MKISQVRQNEIKTSRENVYLRAKTLNSNVITFTLVADIFHLYDNEFFNGQIAKRVAYLGQRKYLEYSTSPYIEFRATKRTSGYGSLSGYYFQKIYDKKKDDYDYKRVFFFDICPNLLDTVFRTTKGKGLPGVAGIGCDDRLRCFMLTVEHEIIHLLMSLWGYDSPGKIKENYSLYGPHGRLFNCMLSTYFGHLTKESDISFETKEGKRLGGHNLTLEGVYVPDFSTESSKVGSRSPKEVGAGFDNWNASCYLDSILVIILENQNSFWKTKIFDWSFTEDQKAVFQSKNPDLSEQVKNAIIEDYEKTRHPSTSPVQCVNVRELLSIQDPLMKTKGKWKMYESGSTYATFVQLFPELLIDIPVKIVRPKLKKEESMTYRNEAAFTYSDFMLSPVSEDEDYKQILWDECQSPVLVFTHQAAPKIKIFDSLDNEKGMDFTKVRAFGPRIINNRYKLVGVIVLHGRIDAKSGGGGHYTCYFLAKDEQWYHYDDISEPLFELIGGIEDLPRDGVWEQTKTQLPTMYFYVLDAKESTSLGNKKVTPVIEKKEVFRGETLDYIRVNRPDRGVIFILVFKTEKKKMIIETIRKFIDERQDVDPNLKNAWIETKLEENKFAWRMPNRSLGDEFQKVIDVFLEMEKTPPENVKMFNLNGKLLKNKAFSVYDYSDKTVAVIGNGVPKYTKELSNLGLETQNLKFNLGYGFIISKSKISSLVKLLNF